MPHILIDYTANLEAAVTQGRLVDAVHQAALDCGVFPVWGVRTLARRVDQYRVGNGDAGNGFVHISVRIAPGRNVELRHRVTHELFAAVQRVMGPLFERQRLGCQIDLSEFEAATTTYCNNLSNQPDPSTPTDESLIGRTPAA